MAARSRSDLRRRNAAWLFAAGGVVAASLVTWRTSDALFTATTANGVNSFGTGNVAIGDNDSGTALFAVTGLKPGSSGQACIRISYTGSLAAAVRVYGTGATATNSLDDYLTLTIDEGSSGATTFPSCAGFVLGTANLFNSTLDNLATTHGTGYGSWAPTGTESRDYRISYSLSAAAPNATMSSSASVTLTWEAQNT
jgi:hypothetical protein